ncbi:RNA polymerase sigma factor [Sediminicola luteus]|uniref:HTH luxR-type domain-containing protein n=1 Tax=Sediminicola luteus TaxID=319238 RepID=A0A2A4G9L5_9FLAO|nr:RNA polymerase sigma-70 factor [Sediminicola luteus]PCE64455.1 hypothetical protein B7P33_09215 [Sediminicola luteus]
MPTKIEHIAPKLPKEVYENIRKGDTRAFTLLVAEYEQWAYNFILQLVKLPHEAEELSQALFIKLWENRTKYDTDRAFEPYMFRIARNLVVDHLRKKARRSAHRQEIWLGMQKLHNPTEDDLKLQEYRTILSEILDSLPEQKKRIFLLSREEGKSNQEIASLLGITPKTVKNHLWKTLQTIKTDLAPHISDLTLPALLLYFLGS